MPTLVDNLALLGRGGPEPAEHRTLGCLDWKVVVVASVEHEHRDLDPRQKVQGIDFWRRALKLQSCNVEHDRTEAGLDGWHQSAQFSAPARAIVGHSLRVDVVTRLEIVD